VTTTTRTALGVGALFVGGLLGGLLGSALFSRDATPGPVGSASERVVVASDPQLREAIEALTRELRRAGVATPADGERRAPANGEGTAPAAQQDFGAVIASLDRLTQALGQARGGAGGGGIGISPLVLPSAGSRADALAGLAGRSAEDLSREYRFLTYQQVLDRFGRPDEVSANSWLYRFGSGEALQVFTFKFSDGYLTNLYP